jgi:hypothetical protein
MTFRQIIGATCLSGLVGFACHVNEARAAETVTLCTPTDVSAFGNRVHIRCSKAVNGIIFFAVDANDIDLSAKVLSLGATAIVFGNRLNIFFDPAHVHGPSFNCLLRDCRPLLGITLLR